MRVSCKMSKQLFDAAETLGVTREELTLPLGLDAARLSDPRNEMEWATLTIIIDRLSVLVNGDVERIRAVGRAMLYRASSLAVLRRLARTVLSLRSLYEAGDRWVAPATFPHVAVESMFVSEQRLRMRACILDPHAPCAAFFHIFEGVVSELPVMLALQPATIARSHVTPRTAEVILDLPRSSSLLGRLGRAFRAVAYSSETVDVLELQRQELTEQLHGLQRTTGEIEQLFDRLPDLVIIHREGKILWNNRAAARTLRYEGTDALVGRTLIDIVAPVSREVLHSRMRTAIGDSDLTDLVEAWLLAREGPDVLVEVSPAQLVTFEGGPARLVVGRDVTERVRMQQRLLTSARMASLGLLAAGVAHEVNNPLAYVLNNIEIAMKDLVPLGETTARSHRALSVALEGVDRIRTIVRDLLVLSRVDERAVGPVDVRAVVESTLALAAEKISERAALRREYHPVPLARGTDARLGQVLLNLLVNALEAMPEETKNTNVLRVVIRSAPGGGSIVEISDNGVGIPPDRAPRVFDPFFTTKASGTGTGLGLSISQSLVAEVGGTLSFESIPNGGTTFRVTLLGADEVAPRLA